LFLKKFVGTFEVSILELTFRGLRLEILRFSFHIRGSFLEVRTRFRVRVLEF
jgi:hypothetical protein